MNSVGVTLRDKDDNMGAGAARAAAEELMAAARAVRKAAERIGKPDGADAVMLAQLLTDAMHRATEGILTAEQLYERQLSAAVILEAGYVQGYEAASASRGLRIVS